MASDEAETPEGSPAAPANLILPDVEVALQPPPPPPRDFAEPAVEDTTTASLPAPQRRSVAAAIAGTIASLADQELSTSHHCDAEFTTSAQIDARMEMALQTQGTFGSISPGGTDEGTGVENLQPVQTDYDDRRGSGATRHPHRRSAAGRRGASPCGGPPRRPSWEDAGGNGHSRNGNGHLQPLLPWPLPEMEGGWWEPMKQSELTKQLMEAANRAEEIGEREKIEVVWRTDKGMAAKRLDSLQELLNNVIRPIFGAGDGLTTPGVCLTTPGVTPALSPRGPSPAGIPIPLKVGVSELPAGASLAFSLVHHEQPPGGRQVWVDVQGLTERELKELAQVVCLHDVTVEDVISGDCPEKLESFERDGPYGYHYAFIRGHRSSREVQALSGVSCVLFSRQGLFLSVHKHGVEGLEDVFRRVKRDFAVEPQSGREPTDPKSSRKDKKRAKQPRMQPLWFLHAVLDSMVDQLIPRSLSLWQKATEVEELVLLICGAEGGAAGEMEDTQRRMGDVRRQVQDLRRLVHGKRTVIVEHRLTEFANFRNILDHLEQMVDQLESARDVLSQASSNHLALASFEAALGANTTNEKMKQLSFLAAVLGPMTLVCSLFGMNVRVPLQGVNETWPFWMIVGSFAFVVVALMMWYTVVRPSGRKRGR
eukprot:Hpha_TRINITY_DN99_c0_g1::TRINITY_DN99_c0_g1_i1::g.110196::m.110196/K16073/ALR, MNR; magnesium transporter